MTAATGPIDPADADGAALRRRVAKLERINAALMAHVERVMDQQGSAYVLFQTAIALEGQVRARTEELTGLMRNLERANDALVAARDEAETANRSKTRFLAAASHDLLQPLNAARLSLSVLAEFVPAGEARAVAAQVERGLQTIEDVIGTLIDISKLDAGVVRPALRPTRADEILAAIDASFRPFAERKALRFVTRCDGSAVETDPVMLQRILQNLVSNAVRYTRAGGNGGGVLVGARRRGTACRIDVVDTGCGIPEEERDRVFEEFYRGGPRVDDGGGGLGLGLSIVRRMARALGHPLDLRSRPGHGTRVTLLLPLASAPVEPATPEAPPPTTLTGARVLLIENDADAADALARVLRGWDATVEAYRDLAGVEAAGGLARPDVILVDHHLDHGRTGLDAVAALRRTRGWDAPVVVTSADHDPAIARAAAALGAELVHKPIKPARLRALLAHMLA